MLQQSWGCGWESGGDRQVNVWGMGKDPTIPKWVMRHAQKTISITVFGAFVCSRKVCKGDWLYGCGTLYFPLWLREYNSRRQSRSGRVLSPKMLIVSCMSNSPLRTRAWAAETKKRKHTQNNTLKAVHESPAQVRELFTVRLRFLSPGVITHLNHSIIGYGTTDKHVQTGYTGAAGGIRFCRHRHWCRWRRVSLGKDRSIEARSTTKLRHIRHRTRGS